MNYPRRRIRIHERRNERARRGDAGNGGGGAAGAGDTGDQKKGQEKEKKEKGITFTREQVEKMELAAKQLESVKDQFTRLTAEYDNYRKRTTQGKGRISIRTPRATTIKALPLPVY